jgi:hypothetical protein
MSLLIIISEPLSLTELILIVLSATGQKNSSWKLNCFIHQLGLGWIQYMIKLLNNSLQNSGSFLAPHGAEETKY